MNLLWFNRSSKVIINSLDCRQWICFHRIIDFRSNVFSWKFPFNEWIVLIHSSWIVLDDSSKGLDFLCSDFFRFTQNGHFAHELMGFFCFQKSRFVLLSCMNWIGAILIKISTISMKIYQFFSDYRRTFHGKPTKKKNNLRKKEKKNCQKMCWAEVPLQN